MEAEHSSSPSSVYTLTQPLEILGVLRTLAKEKRLIQLKVSGQDASILTSLLHIESKKDFLIFDGTSDAALAQQVQAAQTLHFEASESGVRVSFKSGPVHVTSFDEHPAFRVPVPTELVRVQRRDSFRVATSQTKPAYCVIPLSEDKGKVTLQLLDLSTTGLRAIETNQELDAGPGEIFLGCTLQLPNNDPLGVTLRLVHARETERADKQYRYFGFAFENLRGAALARIQRYIATLEREAVARQRGW